MQFASAPSSSAETLDRDNSMPMYHQIRQKLEEQMLLGKLPPGAQVPTEQQLCERHEVSRITARKALEELRESGIIERTRGRGSFVLRLPKGPPAPTEIAILTSDTSETIASNNDSWGTQIVRGLAGVLSAEGFHVTLLPFHRIAEDAQLWERIDDLGPRLAGVLGFASPTAAPVFDELDRRGLPWVTVNPLNREQTHNFVSANNFAGGRRVAREFARLDYRTALFVSTDIRFISNADRFFGFQEGWFEAGGRLEDVRRFQSSDCAGLNEEETARLFQLLSGKNCPRAVFCAGDLLASSVLRACQQGGLAVPEDVTVIGGTGLMLCEHTSPTLTVLAQPMAEISHAAEAMLVEMIKTKQHRLPGRYISCPLIRRLSCPIGKMS